MIQILIVDDKAENLYLLQSMLDSNGYKTISAKNGAEALGLMRNNIPDLIIADILMPVMDGFTLCRECKKDEKLKNIPFFFYTATYTDAKDEEYALSLGADRFILKPQEPDDFLKIIKDFHEKYSQKTFHPKNLPHHRETVILKEYNQVLIRKIEDKMLQTEKSEKELRRYTEELEKEINKRKINEALLRKSEEYNRLLFNSSPIGLSLCKMDGSLVDINPAYAKILGRTIEETLKLSYWEITPEKYLAQEKEQLKILEQTGKYGKYEKEHIHKDGHLVPVLLQGLIIERDGERFIWSSVEDITERKKAEAAVTISQQLFQTLSEVSPVGIFRTSPEGDTTYVNPKWSELSGLTLEEAAGNGWLNAIHPDDRGNVINSWNNVIQAKMKTTAEYRFLKKDGTIVWVIGNVVPEWINNEISGYIGTTTDISAFKKFEKELIDAKEKAEEGDRLKTAFLHNISHEVRTPMNAIIGFSDLITGSDLSSENRNKFLQIIVQSTNQLLSIITQIVNMATIEAGQEKIYEEVACLNSLFTSVLAQYNSEAAKKNISIRFSTPLPENEDAIKTDATKLTQIISNLLGNALKFTKKGFIDIGYVVKDKFLEFYFKDTGIGIPGDQFENIFKRFRQVETTLAREYGGSGLGLSISKAYVELLGGRIWLTSMIGEGSVFYFTIPYKKVSLNQAAGTGQPKQYFSDLKANLTLLVAEDEDNNFKLLEEYFANVNITVLHASNGSEAVELCKINKQVNLVLMDLKMPVMDGFEAAKTIKGFLPDLPIIAQTAYGREVDKEKAFACGCSDFLMKPFKKEELFDLIRKRLIIR